MSPASGFNSKMRSAPSWFTPWFTAAAKPRFSVFAQTITPASRATATDISLEALSTTTTGAFTNFRQLSKHAPSTASELCVTTTTPSMLLPNTEPEIEPPREVEPRLTLLLVQLSFLLPQERIQL